MDNHNKKITKANCISESRIRPHLGITVRTCPDPQPPAQEAHLGRSSSRQPLPPLSHRIEESFGSEMTLRVTEPNK